MALVNIFCSISLVLSPFHHHKYFTLRAPLVVEGLYSPPPWQTSPSLLLLLLIIIINYSFIYHYYHYCHYYYYYYYDYYYHYYYYYYYHYPSIPVDTYVSSLSFLFLLLQFLILISFFFIFSLITYPHFGFILGHGITFPHKYVSAGRFQSCSKFQRTYATNTKRDEDQKSPNTGIYRVAVWLAGCQHIGQRLSSLPSWFS